MLRYGVGGFMNVHYDAFADRRRHREEQRMTGGRTTTILVYLNDTYEGSATVFPNLTQRIAPERGKAIIFHNVDTAGNVLIESAHLADVVTRGENGS